MFCSTLCFALLEFNYSKNSTYIYIYIWINYWLTRASLCLVAHLSWHLFPRVIISFSTLRVSSTFNYTTYTITHSRDLQNNSKKWHTNLLGWITKLDMKNKSKPSTRTTTLSNQATHNITSKYLKSAIVIGTPNQSLWSHIQPFLAPHVIRLIGTHERIVLIFWS